MWLKVNWEPFSKHMIVSSQQTWVTVVFLRLTVIHLATVTREAGADPNAQDGVLPGQRTWGRLSETCVSDDTLVSLAAPERSHTLVCLVARYPGNIFHHFPVLNHGIYVNVSASTGESRGTLPICHGASRARTQMQTLWTGKLDPERIMTQSWYLPQRCWKVTCAW